MVGVRAADRGASQVVGTVLLISVVVVIAATVGAYAFGFSDQTRETAPQVATTTDYNESIAGGGQNLTVVVQSGDVVDTANLTLLVADAVAVDRTTGDADPVRVAGDPLVSQAGSTLTASNRIKIDAGMVERTDGTSLGADEYLDLSDAVVRIVWDPVPVETDQSQVIVEWSAADA